MDHSELPAEAKTRLLHGLLSWPPFWFFILLILAVGIIGYVAYEQNMDGAREKEERVLSTIADLKVDEIAKWRAERIGDAETLAQSSFWLGKVEKWMQGRLANGENRSMILERMDVVRRAYGYRDIYLFDSEGEPLLATSPQISRDPSLTDAVKEAIRTQRIVFRDIEILDTPGDMGVAAPILVVRDGKSQAIGANYLQIDPYRFLFPLLKTIPLTDKRMTIDLVRREGKDVLFLSVPAASDLAGLLRIPADKPNLVAAIAVSGKETEAAGVDYRGVPVFAAFRKIPGSEWFLVTKVEQEEIFAPLREKMRLVAGVVIVLIALTGIAVGLWWRNQLARFRIGEQKQTEKNLRAASAYVRSLIEASLDPLVTISPAGKITDVNKASEEATGFTRNELIGTEFDDYFTEPQKARAGRQKVLDQGFVHNYPLTIRHRSGRLIDVLYSATVYRDEARNVQGMFAAARDVTERKTAELALQKRMKELTCLFAVSQDMQESLPIDEVCRRAVAHLASAMQFPGIAVPVLDVKDKRYTSDNYTEGLSHSLHAEFKTGAEAFGRLFVYYREERPFLLPDEQNMVNAVAQAFSTWLERNRVEEALREQEEFFRLITENVDDFIAVLDLEGRRLYNSPSYGRLFRNLAAMKGTDSFTEVHPDDRERIRQVFRETVESSIGQRTEFRFIGANGEIRYMESSGGLIKDSHGTPMRVVVVSHDITARKIAEEEVNKLAFYDTLTQLPNRRLEEDRLEQAMAISKRSGRYGALLFLDLDNFKPLNDEHGHDAGDLLLKEVARRISKCVREMDTVARFGGDEFVVVLSELDENKDKSTTEAGNVAEKVRAAIAEPYLLTLQDESGAGKPVEHHCTASIGLALFNDHGASAEETLKCADMAMYHAKRSGRNLICFYEQMHEESFAGDISRGD